MSARNSPGSPGGCWDHARPWEAETNQGGPCPWENPVESSGTVPACTPTDHSNAKWTGFLIQLYRGGRRGKRILRGGQQKACSGAGSKVQGSLLPGAHIACPTLDLLNPPATLGDGPNRPVIHLCNIYSSHTSFEPGTCWAHRSSPGKLSVVGEADK